MVQLAQIALSVLSLAGWPQLADIFYSGEVPWTLPHAASPAASVVTPKSIAIVGAGSGGLAVLKTLLDLPEEVRSSWEIVLYEQRSDVGGLWFEDPLPPHPPTLPESPVYPRLHTNTPHPTMTYPGFTFPPGTPLFPSHEYVWRYHADFAEHYNLTSYIHLNHTVLAAGWKGTRSHGKWVVDVQRNDASAVVRKTFDHLVVANGHNHYPHIPHWPGEDIWLENTPVGAPKRELLHSIFYREPEAYANLTVVIVGGGASGRDAALQVGPLAKTYQSLRPGTLPPDGAQVTVKPPITHFTASSVFFEDGSHLSNVDSIILATGYEFKVPFLSRVPRNAGIKSPALVAAPNTHVNSTTAHDLTTNLRYIFPLYEHIFSLSSEHPASALAFVGLPILIANCPSDRAQSLLIAHAIANSTTLPSRTDMFAKLRERENNVRERGFDPYVVGHRMVGGDNEAQAYQNSLVQYLKDVGQLPEDGKDYVEPWRVVARNESFLLSRGWSRVEALGEQDKWLQGIETEDQWADLLFRLRAWQAKWEEKHGKGLDMFAAA